MAAQFSVVDAQGTDVDVGVVVRALADEVAEAPGDLDDLFQDIDHKDRLLLRVKGVPACTGFHFQATSHTGQSMEDHARRREDDE